jgi:hypothetical protein
MKQILFFFALMISISAEQESITHYNSLRVVTNPERSSVVFIPKEFIPESSQLKNFIENDIIATEAILVIETNEKSSTIIPFLEKQFKNLDWRIFRKDINQKNSVFQVENSSKRILSILILEEKNFTRIKYFFKRQSRL